MKNTPKIIYNSNPSQKAKKILHFLTQAVQKELDRKRRLGQYAVFCDNGKIILEGEDIPLKLQKQYSNDRK